MNELYHHGVKGQKWGIRRYQNADGTLTPAGRLKYGIELRKEVKGYKISTKANYDKAKQEYRDFRKSGIKDSVNRDKLKQKVKAARDEKRIANALTKNKYKSLYFKTRDPEKKRITKDMVISDDKFNRTARKALITAVGAKLVGIVIANAVQGAAMVGTGYLINKKYGKEIVDNLFKKGGKQ